MTDGVGVFDWLEDRGPSLILVAGVLTTITAVLSAVGLTTTLTTDPYEMTIAPFAFLLLFLGVLRLFPRLAARAPRLTSVAAFFAVVGAVFAPLLGIVAAADLVGLVADVPLAVLGSHLLGRHAGQVALILFSVDVLRTGVYPRAIGLLLLGPAAVMLLALVHIVVSGPAWATPPLVAANAIAMLALGYHLWKNSGPDVAESKPIESAV